MELALSDRQSKFFRPAVIIIAMMHAAGVIGLASPWNAWFTMLTPFHLLAVFLALIAFQRDASRSFRAFAVIVLLSTWIIECAGVNTGLIFGEYSYGSVLGPKVYGTPLIIGVNWFILLVSIGTVVQSAPWNRFVKSAMAALIMTAVDVLIEPVAIAFGFWSWTATEVPIVNYLAWFVASFILFLLFYRMPFEKANRMAPWVLGLQVSFFLALNIILLSHG